MPDKITLNSIGSLQDTTTAATTLNNNFDITQEAFDNTLSRDGSFPNQMESAIDMNGNQIINLPSPTSMNSPVRLEDVNNLVAGGTINVSPLPAGGTTGQYLIKNSGTNYDASWNNLTLINEAAYTIKGNPTNVVANTTDISIPALTSKATPTSSDIIMISDSAAGGALKSATLGNVNTASGIVSTIAGNTGNFTLTKGIANTGNAIELALNSAVLQTTPQNPTGTTSATTVMMGLGSVFTLTPVYSSRIKITITGFVNSSAATQLAALQIFTGTGSAPLNGGVSAGTALGSQIFATSTGAGAQVPFALTGILTGLTPGTAYWVDLGASSSTTSSGVTIRSICASIEEF